MDTSDAILEVMTAIEVSGLALVHQDALHKHVDTTDDALRKAIDDLVVRRWLVRSGSFVTLTSWGRERALPGDVN